ncbi:hypothetical protein NCU01074 [Neurospora crassa OR74A]|uniref:BZIP domain-containing protein n=2 Tax=Neurospora crassa TaxID=5141 RepID=V5IMT8_NEUCR|nr:hypothetical protein NCU01074 [Neurospora crassa OR74A]ESA42494.1 hypothetical protein NCU01074 [Neurospora crassa OR74A]CAD21317.1 hypothetical protein [Neurospora crassa]|eukprot:XP_011394462.1 hypothetical protein NCU01074 [Neurospora crassa OR74A]
MSSSKPSAHPYSLPDLTQTKLSVEDDWTKVKDRKEKKRIQNRVAQRTYRYRMKARLGELQQKLEYHERNKATLTYGDAPGVGDSENTSRSPSVQLPTPTYTTDNSPSPRANELMVFNDIHLPNYHSPHVFHTDASQLFDLSPITTPLTSQPSGVFTVEQSNITDSGYSSAVVHEYLRLHMQPFDTQHRAADGQTNNYAIDGSAHGNDPFLVHDSPDIDPLLFSTERHDTMTAGFTEEGENKVLNWKAQPPPLVMSNPGQAGALTSPVTQDLPEMKKTRTSNRTACRTTSAEVNQKAPRQQQQHQPASLPTKRPTLDERMESVMERVETEGFDNFDSLATLYYKAKFGDSSSLAVEQRLSRTRRLPKLFADVFSAAQQEWGAREQRPLFDEILRMSEGMLIGEARGVHSTLHASIGGLARSAAKDHETGKSAVSGLKRLMEDNLSNLWALVTALATENRAVRQRDRSNTVLATILVLQCSGQLPKQSLMALLDACL